MTNNTISNMDNWCLPCQGLTLGHMKTSLVTSPTINRMGDDQQPPYKWFSQWPIEPFWYWQYALLMFRQATDFLFFKLKASLKLKAEKKYNISQGHLKMEMARIAIPVLKSLLIYAKNVLLSNRIASMLQNMALRQKVQVFACRIMLQSLKSFQILIQGM